MNHDIDKIRKNPKLEGQIGENAIWEGPLSKVGFPMGQGSSSGIVGMQVSKSATMYEAGPVTKRCCEHKN